MAEGEHASEEEEETVEQEEEEEEEAATTPATAADPKQDDVKPVVFIGLFLTALFAMGAADLLLNMEDNGCKMTWMYELPQYVRINMSEQVSAKFPKYGLFAYGEGENKYVDRLKSEKFNGIPVLFIPGNSGSHKQVRSLASVALRKAIKDSEYKIHFDYFSIDFDEEHSAFYGGVLNGQVEYVSQAVRKILSLYKSGKSVAPTSVVLVGHSLGGMIAKALFTLPHFLPSEVSMVLTLATPHSPVLVLDKQTHDFYHKVDTYWAAARQDKLAHVTLVSIGGGLRDIQVRSGLTADSRADMNMVSTAVSGVWVSADHRCIVWCKQIVMAINRALFDMIGPVTKQIIGSPVMRKEVLAHHLVLGGEEQYDPDKELPTTVQLDKNGYWSDILKRQFTVVKGNVTCDHYMMIKLATDDPKQRFLTLDAVRMEADNWVFGCKETVIHRNIRVCEQGENLSAGSIILPGRRRRRAVHLDLLELRKTHGYSHLVVAAPSGSEGTRVNIDVYSPRERQLTYAVPKWINFWREFAVVEQTAPGSVFYNVSLTGMENPWQAYSIKVLPLQCTAPAEGEKTHYGLARFITPWAMDTTQTLIGEGANFTNSLTAKLQTPRPQGSNDTTDIPQMHLYLNPACSYRITIRASFPEIMGQMVRFHLSMMLPCAAAALLMILAFQCRRIEQDRTVKSTLLTLASCVSPVNVVLPSRLVAYIAAMGPVAAFLPATDIHFLQARGLDFGILPIMMFFLAIGLTLILTGLAWVAVVLLGGLAHKAVVKMAGTVAPHEAVGEAAVSALEKFPSILAAVLIALACATCGSLALAVGCFAYFIKLFKMYEEYLETVVKRGLGLTQEDDSSLLLGIHFQFTLALLWSMVSLLNLPTLMAWTQNLSHGVALPADPSFIHAIILCGSIAVLWQNDGKPKVDKKYFAALAIILHALAIFIGTFGLVTMYRVSFAISAAFVVVSTHQLISPDRSPEETEEEQIAATTTDLGQETEVARTPTHPTHGDGEEGEEGLDWEYEEIPGSEGDGES